MQIMAACVFAEEWSKFHQVFAFSPARVLNVYTPAGLSHAALSTTHLLTTNTLTAMECILMEDVTRKTVECIS